MWFDSWGDIVSIVLVGTVFYVTLVAILRLSGKRTLSQLNVFDFIVTVALGSVLATTLLTTDVTFTEGLTALVLLAGLQFLIATISSVWPRTRQVLTSDSVLLLADGQIRHEALKRNRLTESELRQAVRSEGNGDLSRIKAVVLETNGKISVISDSQYGNGSAVLDVLGAEHL